MRVFSVRRFVCLSLLSIGSLLASAQATTFKNPQVIDTSYDPLAIATADLNGDGILDIVYVDGIAPYTLHVLLGNGNGTFAHKSDIELPLGVGPRVNLADVTHDGIPDIIVGGNTSTAGEIAVFPGNGDGTFGAAVISMLQKSGSNGGSASFNLKMGVGDVNGDGAADLVAGDPTSATLYVLLGDNTGRFSIGHTFTFYFTGYTYSYLFDLNGDGHLDIIVNDLVGAQTYVLLGNGDGTFKPAVVYLSFALLFADMDGDGHPDLVGRSPNVLGQAQILKGNADGTFGAPTVIATFPASASLVASGDFNGDGIPDLLFITPAGLGVMLGEGNLTFGNFISSVAGSATGYPDDFALGAFSGKNYSDVAMTADGGLVILQSNGDGTFASADSYDIGHTAGTVSVADFNGDKIPDIAVTASATYPRLLIGDGTGKFTLGTDQNQSYGSQPPSASMLSADFNGDGKNDLDMLGPSSYTYPYGQPLILFGEGNGTFATPIAIASGPALVGDLNNDGRADMVSQSGDSILTLLGQSNETFTQVTTPLIYPTYGVAALGDLNHDGKPDLLVFEYPSMRVWLGNGDGTFTQSNLVSESLPQINAQSVTIADLDNDGNADIVVVPYPNQNGFPLPFLIYYGNADGTFQDGVPLPVSHAYTQLVIADINRDNKPDLVLSDGGGIAVITNLGGRNFAPEEHFVAGQNISGLSVVDVNGDGYPDIVAANAGGTTVAVLLNQPNGNPVDGAPSNGSFSISPEPAQYSQPVTLSITMSVPSGSMPTGTVSFSVDGSFIATHSLVNGKATYAYGGVLNTGTHTFVAAYNGDKTYAPESFSLLHQVESPVYATNTVLVAAPTVLYASQTVSLTATVSSSVSVPNGTVTFYDGTNTLGSRAMASYGSSVFLLDTNLLAAGVHSLTATYQGWQDPFNEQAVYQPSTSAAVTVTVNSYATTTTVQASNTSLSAGTVVTFTASTSSSSGIPFGGATFYDGSVPLGTTSLLAGGTCTYSTASLAVGTHNITATFNANATFAGSTSPATVVTVTSAASGLVPTAVTMAVTGNRDQSVIVANVSTFNGVPAGRVVFLDGGTILGSASAEGSGTASLTVPALAVGAHNLFASFAGTSQFAPSVSPALIEQFPAGGAGFSLSASQNAIDLTSSGSAAIPFTVIPTAGFRDQVHLFCADGVPAACTCSFSPDLLFSGSSYLRIQPLSAQHRSGSLLYPPAIGAFFFLLLGFGCRRRTHYVVALIVCLGLATMTGCGNSSSSSGQPKMMVLSVRATAGVGATLAVHSAQILLNITSSH